MYGYSPHYGVNFIGGMSLIEKYRKGNSILTSSFHSEHTGYSTFKRLLTDTHVLITLHVDGIVDSH